MLTGEVLRLRVLTRNTKISPVLFGLAVAYVGLVLAVASGCGRADAGSAAGESFGFSLAAHASVPSIDVAVRVVPAVEAAFVVQGISQALTDALAACMSEARDLGFRTPMTVAFKVAHKRAGPAGHRPVTALDACLERAVLQRNQDVLPLDGEFEVALLARAMAAQ